MIQFQFIDRDSLAPWGDSPLTPQDAWIIGVRAKTGPVAGARERIPNAQELAKDLKIDGATAGDCAVVRRGLGWLGAVSLGTPQNLTARHAETLGRNIGATIGKPGLRRVFVDGDLFPITAAAVAAGIALRATPQLDLRSKAEKQNEDAFAPAHPCPVEVIILTTNADKAQAAWDEHFAPGVMGTLWARDLMTSPANILNPVTLQQQAETLTQLGATVTSLNATALRQNKLNLLHAVGKGSNTPPRLIIIEWPGVSTDHRHKQPDPVVLVGKGITFDTGGISIKPAAGMEEMKGDMGGAAAVLGAMLALATRKSPQRVIGLLAVAENAVSGKATRPGDVLKACNGTSVEIVDTDAEGRLVLADALAYAVQKYQPTLMVDLATLTGAVVRTLGSHHAGLFTPSDAVQDQLHNAATEANEPIWRLPLPSTADESLKSDVADLKNCAWGMVPDAVHAAGFLSNFVGETPWAHLDIAGTADSKEDTPLLRKGPRGFGVRLLDQLIRNLEA